jgi:hypothetical protein
MKLARVFVNLAAYQAGWVAAVLGAANGLPWLGFLAAIPVVGIHLGWIERHRSEIAVLLVAALVGTLLDSLVQGLGFVRFTGSPAGAWISPLWISALWLMFATLFNVSLRWLQGRPALAALLGAIGGPPAYLTARALGAASMPEDLTVGILAVAVEYSVAMPIVLWTAGAIRRRAERSPDPAASRVTVAERIR